jgi:hypothetical protein
LMILKNKIQKVGLETNEGYIIKTTGGSAAYCTLTKK